MPLSLLFLAIAAALAPCPARAATNPLSHELASVSGRPFTALTLPAPAGPPVTSIVYGHDDYGYFETRRFSVKEGRIHLTFLPPGYRRPLTFWGRAGRLKKLGTRTFVSPFPARLTPATPEKGNLSFPFVSGVGKFFAQEGPDSPVAPNPSRRLYSYFINRQGEFVWLHLPTPFPAVRDHEAFLQAAGGGRYHVMRCTRSRLSSIEELDLEGRSYWRHELPEYCHHDFRLRDGKLIYLSASHYGYRPPWKFWRPKDVFRGSVLKERNLSTGETKTLWDPLSAKNPYSDPDWTRTFGYDPDYLNSGDESGKAWNLMHANSLQEIPGLGVLISIRNLNRVVLMSPDFSRTLWSAGPSQANTFPTRGTPSEFRLQHHAQWLPTGRLLVFDNYGKKQSRVLELALDRPHRKLRVEKDFSPTPPLLAPVCGSAKYLPEGDLVAFFPAFEKELPSYLVEFDGGTTKEKARLRIEPAVGPSDRMSPYFALGEETFLGFTLQTSKAPIAAAPVTKTRISRPLRLARTTRTVSEPKRETVSATD